MIHQDRRFGIRPTNSPLELARLLSEHVWTLCTGFELRGVLFLNDSFSPGGAQEYAVVYQGRQLASLTVAWLSQAELLEQVEGLVAERPSPAVALCTPMPVVEFKGHRCRLCA